MRRAATSESVCVRKGTHVADGHLALQRREVRVGEDLGHEAEVLAHEDARAVAHRDAGALLTAVLQRVQAKVGHAGNVAVGCPDADDAALVMQRLVGSNGLFEREVLLVHV